VNTHLFDMPAPDKELVGPGAIRTYQGEYIERIVCRAMGWQRLTVDARQEFCPDAETADGTPIEIKSVRVSSTYRGKSVIYDWRMEKEERLAPDLIYVFAGCRSPGGATPTTLSELLDRLARSTIMLALVRAPLVHRKARRQRKRKIERSALEKSPDAGYHRAGYRDGYRNVPVHTWFHYDKHLPKRIAVERYGRTFTVLAPGPTTPSHL